MASLEDSNSLSDNEKQSRLIDAVKRNDVDRLKVLLDSPKWYNTRDQYGVFNLLQIAIIQDNQEVFDYLLSLPDYPLEFKNPEDITLELIFNYPWTEEKEYFACELIQKGACIDKICDKGDTLLHPACKRGFLKASMLLIEKGIDVNARGYKNYTPLQFLCKCNPFNIRNYTEIILMLLEFGADSSITDKNGYTPFENSVKFEKFSIVYETLFYYTYDKFSVLEIHLETLLTLALHNSSLIEEIIKRQFEIVVETNQSSLKRCLKKICFINLTNLKTLIKWFNTSLKIFFAQTIKVHIYVFKKLSIDKLNILIESSLKDEIINNLLPLLWVYLPHEMCFSQNISELSELICFWLSYGMEIEEECLYLIYKKFGYCDLFKILLHMDIKKKTIFYPSCILPNLLINVSQNFEDLIKDLDNIPLHELRKLISYFAHSKLNSMYRVAFPKESINLPQVPSLLELSRNVFRSFFVDKFQIKTSRNFYTLLNSLEINSVYKKIIIFETKLYSL